MATTFDSELHDAQEAIELDEPAIRRVIEAVDGDGLQREALERIVRNVVGKYLAAVALEEART